MEYNGMILDKIAIGDASGQKYEFLNKAKIKNPIVIYPQISGNPFTDSLITDDTWYAFITLYALENDKSIESLLLKWFLTAPISIGAGTLKSLLRRVFHIKGKNMSAGNFPMIPALIIGKHYFEIDNMFLFIKRTMDITHHHPLTLYCSVYLASLIQPKLSSGYLQHILDDASDKKIIEKMFSSLDGIKESNDILKTPYALERKLDKGITAFCVDTLYAVLAIRKLELSFEESIKLAISLGGDTDSVASMVAVFKEIPEGKQIDFSGLEKLINSYWKLLFYTQITNIRLLIDAIKVRLI